MICLLINVATTQDVPLDGTILSGNTVILSFLYLMSKKARVNAAVSAFLSFIKSWHDVKVSK